MHSPDIEQLKESGIEPKVLVISKLQPLRSHTGSAEGGIAASLGNVEQDDWHWHYYDTVKGGDWLVDQDAAKLLAEYAPQTVINLERMGVAFSRTDDGHIAQHGSVATPRISARCPCAGRHMRRTASAIRSCTRCGSSASRPASNSPRNGT